MPVLIFADAAAAPADAGELKGTRFIGDAKRIAGLLADRYGIPSSH
ncbi:hypothetical protein ABID16_000547 [Rhizobium aquaticum]|uniref:Uncharacterized protein n=1 Tax=Rhizobium aquaticum TaxID=1549636 RepID=A0ABV2IUS7_9HYPH